MRVNADFDQPVTIRPEDREWVASPSSGVERCMLDRVGGEIARATSLVRFAPDSSFPTHTHGGGEEYIVLEGVFSDNTGDFPEGTYVRNPVGTAHAPHTAPGCMIFVKLHQFHPDDQHQFQASLDGAPQKASRNGDLLHETTEESVRLVLLKPGESLTPDTEGGCELLLLSGAATLNEEEIPAGTWSRQPIGSTVSITAGDDGARLWIKCGHLAHIRLPEDLA